MPQFVRQAAALPLRGGLVCMVTSRSGRRWVLPKGRIEPRQTPAEAAAAEAWEEAGLSGTVGGGPVGEYGYEKWGRLYRVQVFVLAVDRDRADYPECGQRTREWVTPEEAVARIEEPDLRAVVAAVCGVAVEAGAA